MRALIRKAISDAYYDARNAGRTMEDAADAAAAAVLELLETQAAILPLARCDGFNEAHGPHDWDWGTDGVIRWCDGRPT